MLSDLVLVFRKPCRLTLFLSDTESRRPGKSSCIQNRKPNLLCWQIWFGSSKNNVGRLIPGSSNLNQGNTCKRWILICCNFEKVEPILSRIFPIFRNEFLHFCMHGIRSLIYLISLENNFSWHRNITGNTSNCLPLQGLSIRRSAR